MSMNTFTTTIASISSNSAYSRGGQTASASASASGGSSNAPGSTPTGGTPGIANAGCSPTTAPTQAPHAVGGGAGSYPGTPVKASATGAACSTPTTASVPSGALVTFGASNAFSTSAVAAVSSGASGNSARRLGPSAYAQRTKQQQAYSPDAAGAASGPASPDARGGRSSSAGPSPVLGFHTPTNSSASIPVGGSGGGGGGGGANGSIGATHRKMPSYGFDEGSFAAPYSTVSSGRAATGGYSSSDNSTPYVNVALGAQHPHHHAPPPQGGASAHGHVPGSPTTAPASAPTFTIKVGKDLVPAAATMHRRTQTSIPQLPAAALQHPSPVRQTPSTGSVFVVVAQSAHASLTPSARASAPLSQASSIGSSPMELAAIPGSAPPPPPSAAAVQQQPIGASLAHRSAAHEGRPLVRVGASAPSPAVVALTRHGHAYTPSRTASYGGNTAILSSVGSASLQAHNPYPEFPPQQQQHARTASTSSGLAISIGSPPMASMGGEDKDERGFGLSRCLLSPVSPPMTQPLHAQTSSHSQQTRTPVHATDGLRHDRTSSLGGVRESPCSPYAAGPALPGPARTGTAHQSYNFPYGLGSTCSTGSCRDPATAPASVSVNGVTASISSQRNPHGGLVPCLDAASLNSPLLGSSAPTIFSGSEGGHVRVPSFSITVGNTLISPCNSTSGVGVQSVAQSHTRTSSDGGCTPTALGPRAAATPNGGRPPATPTVAVGPLPVASTVDGLARPVPRRGENAYATTRPFPPSPVVCVNVVAPRPLGALDVDQRPVPVAPPLPYSTQFAAGSTRLTPLPAAPLYGGAEDDEEEEEEEDEDDEEEEEEEEESDDATNSVREHFVPVASDMYAARFILTRSSPYHTRTDSNVSLPTSASEVAPAAQRYAGTSGSQVVSPFRCRPQHSHHFHHQRIPLPPQPLALDKLGMDNGEDGSCEYATRAGGLRDIDATDSGDDNTPAQSAQSSQFRGLLTSIRNVTAGGTSRVTSGSAESACSQELPSGSPNDDSVLGSTGKHFAATLSTTCNANGSSCYLTRTFSGGSVGPISSSAAMTGFDETTSGLEARQDMDSTLTCARSYSAGQLASSFEVPRAPGRHPRLAQRTDMGVQLETLSYAAASPHAGLSATHPSSSQGTTRADLHRAAQSDMDESAGEFVVSSPGEETVPFPSHPPRAQLTVGGLRLSSPPPQQQHSDPQPFVVTGSDSCQQTRTFNAASHAGPSPVVSLTGYYPPVRAPPQCDEPADASGGHAHLLSITVGGKRIPPLPVSEATGALNQYSHVPPSPPPCEQQQQQRQHTQRQPRQQPYSYSDAYECAPRYVATPYHPHAATAAPASVSLTTADCAPQAEYPEAVWPARTEAQPSDAPTSHSTVAAVANGAGRSSTVAVDMALPATLRWASGQQRRRGRVATIVIARDE